MAETALENAKDPQVYEVAFHIDPNLSDTEVAAVYARVRALLSQGGEVIAEGEPKRMTLAYTISRIEAGRRYDFSHSFFAWVASILPPESVESIDKALALDKGVIRYLVVKTTAEAAKHAEEMHKARREVEGEGEEEVPAEAQETPEAAPEEARATL